MQILNEIVEHTRQQIILRKEKVSEAMLYTLLPNNPKVSRFFDAVSMPIKGDIGIIAEIKHRSPSAGNFSSMVSVMDRVTAYEKSGADAISYVSDSKYFGGSLEELKRITSISRLPVLQKDFVISMYQLVEAAITQVDAILLIARITGEKELKSYVNFAQINGIEPVVEVYNEVDLDKALKTDTKIIGVNARDLDTFEIDLKKATTLMQMIPSHISVIGFSGVNSRKDIEVYKGAGAKAVLVGSTLMNTDDVTGSVKELKRI